MGHLKARLLALAIIAVFAGLIYFNWHQLHTEGSYSMKLAGRAQPVGNVRKMASSSPFACLA